MALLMAMICLLYRFVPERAPVVSVESIDVNRSVGGEFLRQHAVALSQKEIKLLIINVS